VKITLLFLKNHDVCTYTLEFLFKLSNCSFDMTGLRFSVLGNSIKHIIPIMASIAANTINDAKYPPKYLFVNSPNIGPTSRPTPLAISACPKTFSRQSEKVDAKIENATS